MLKNLTITKASELLDKKQITSEQLTRYYLDRINKVDPTIGAYLLVCEEYALTKAKEADERIEQDLKKIIYGHPTFLIM